MVQDISPKIFFNDYHPHVATGDDFLFIFLEKTFLVKEVPNQSEEPDIQIPLAKDFPEISKDDCQFLFRIDEASYFLYRGEDPILPKNHFKYYDKVKMRRELKGDIAFAYMNAWHLHVWYKENKYCGTCGNLRTPSDKERALVCTACGHMTFPKIMPAVIVAVTCQGKLLVSKYADKRTNHWALIAGFVEFGESGEDTVRREVMEEVGLKVKNIQYFASQPWGIDQDLLLGYTCEVDGDDTIQLDENELSTARWMEPKDIPANTNLLSLTATMIEHFRTTSFETPASDL